MLGLYVVFLTKPKASNLAQMHFASQFVVLADGVSSASYSLVGSEALNFIRYMRTKNATNFIAGNVCVGVSLTTGDA